MQNFKKTSENDNAWKELVLKMKDADESKIREATSFEKQVNAIIFKKKGKNFIPTNKRASSYPSI